MVSDAEEKQLYTNYMISIKVWTVSTAHWFQFWTGARQSEAAEHTGPLVTTVITDTSGLQIFHCSAARRPRLRWPADRAGIDKHSDVFNQFMEPFPSQL